MSKPNYAINPTPELYLRSNRALLPARVIAALDLMNWHNGILIAAFVLVGNVASASGYESCDLIGRVDAVIVRRAPDSYRLNVRVLGVQESLKQEQESSATCGEYVGETMEVLLTFPSPSRPPDAGDVVYYHRSAVDVFDRKGSYAGKDIAFGLNGPTKELPNQQ